MRYLIVIYSLLSSVSSAQTNATWQCWKIDTNGKEILVDCDDLDFTPNVEFTGNIDSLCWEMEKRFVNELNAVRLNLGLHELEYDHRMHSALTLPHNEWQVKNGNIAHGEDGKSLAEIARSKGFDGVGECVAYNSSLDSDESSRFLAQYNSSPPHWKILTDSRFKYIAVSVLYDPEINRFYSTVNVRW